jgi:hypothetical protein
MLVMAGLGLLSPGRRYVVYSSVLVACLIYLVGMDVASLSEVDVSTGQVWRQVRISPLIFAFLMTTGSLVAAFPSYTRWLFLAVGTAAAASAAINIGLYFVYLAPEHIRTLAQVRLLASIGMPEYANSTNISATYAVFFAGVAGTMLYSQVTRLQRAILAVDAAVLFSAVLLTQARSAWLAVLASLVVLMLVASRRIRWTSICVLLVAGVAVFAVPVLRETIFARGDSYRLEIWTRFVEFSWGRPLLGFGSFSPIGVTLKHGRFIDQAHNLVLSAWFRGGLASGLAMAWMLLGSLYWSRRFWSLTGNAVPLSVMTATFTAGMFDYQLMITHPTWPWLTFWLPFGLGIGAEMAWRIRSRETADQHPASAVVRSIPQSGGGAIELAQQADPPARATG